MKNSFLFLVLLFFVLQPLGLTQTKISPAVAFLIDSFLKLNEPNYYNQILAEFNESISPSLAAPILLEALVEDNVLNGSTLNGVQITDLIFLVLDSPSEQINSNLAICFMGNIIKTQGKECDPLEAWFTLEEAGIYIPTDFLVTPSELSVSALKKIIKPNLLPNLFPSGDFGTPSQKPSSTTINCFHCI